MCTGPSRLESSFLLFPGNGLLSITDSANGPKVLLVTVSKVGCKFWLVVVGMSLCRGKELSVVPSRSDVENGANEIAVSCSDGVLQ